MKRKMASAAPLRLQRAVGTEVNVLRFGQPVKAVLLALSGDGQWAFVEMMGKKQQVDPASITVPAKAQGN